MAYTSAPPSSVAASTVFSQCQTASGQWAYLIAIRDGRVTTATTLSVAAKGLRRSTGGTVSTTITPGKLNSRAQATYVIVNSTWSVLPTASGNVILWLSRTEDHEAVYTWRPPRPWAAPQIIDAEMIDLRGTSTGNLTTFLYTEEPNHTPWRRLARRPRHPGLWGYHNEQRAYAHSAASPVYDINRPVTNQWVAYVRSERPRLPNVNAIASPIVLLTATLTASPLLQGTVSRSYQLLATLSASPLLSGALNRSRSLAGTVTASPALSGTISRARSMVGTLSASPVLSGSLARARSLAGTLTASPAVSGTLSSARHLAGTVTASPAISGMVALSRHLAGTVSAAPNLSGALSRARDLSVQLAASPAIEGALSLSRDLAATVTANPAINGSLSRAQDLAGSMIGLPAINGTLTRIRSMSGTVSASAAIYGHITISGVIELAGIIAGSPAISGALSRTSVLAGTIAGLPLISGIIDRLRTLEGLILGSPLLEGQLTWIPPFVHRPTHTLTLPPRPSPVIDLEARTNAITLEPPTLREITLTPRD